MSATTATSKRQKLAIIVGSTRPGRKGLDVAAWVLQQVLAMNNVFDAQFIDLAAVNLPFLDEPKPAATGEYQHEHTRRWSQRIAAFDAFVFVTPEYNASVPAALKNAIDFLCKEWANKPAGIVSYGGGGGGRAAKHLRDILGNLKMQVSSEQVQLTLGADFVNYTTFQTRAEQENNLQKLLVDLSSDARDKETKG